MVSVLRVGAGRERLVQNKPGHQNPAFVIRPFNVQLRLSRRTECVHQDRRVAVYSDIKIVE